MADIRAHVTISGIVQGVFFRGTTADMARELGLAGWVRNLEDGRVEAVFEGPEAAVEEAVDWVSHGPSHAVVERVEVERGEPLGEDPFHTTW